MADTTLKSNLDLARECDTFPYPYAPEAAAYAEQVTKLYHLRVLLPDDSPSPTLGYVLPSVALALVGLPDWHLSPSPTDPEPTNPTPCRTLTLLTGRDKDARTAAVRKTCLALQQTRRFRVLDKWRDELYAVHGPGGPVLFDVERAASPLFGIVTYGVHMVCFVRAPGAAPHGVKLWVPRRARAKQTYGGMLDNTVAGGIASGETPFECLVRESAEEASLPEEVVRGGAKAVGAVTYFYIRDERAGGETGLMQPECQYVYDLELPDDVVPAPCDDEVEQFYLWNVDEVVGALRRGEFKPNCAIVVLDFFIRHGILNEENEENLIEIVARLHRRLEFPVRMRG